MLVIAHASMEPLYDQNGKSFGTRAGALDWVRLDDGKVEPADPVTFAKTDHTRRSGMNYGGPGRYFNGWDMERGVFGFAAEGHDIAAHAGSPFAGSPFKAGTGVKAVFSDFAVSAPWAFDALATAKTAFRDVYPPEDEEFACIARLVNLSTGGEMILVGDGVANALPPAEWLRRLGLRSF
jgi:hypothetical protein